METQMIFRGFMWGGIVTVLIIGAALVGSLIYIAFFAHGFNVLQDVVVVLVSLIVAAVLVSIMWMLWWMPHMPKNMNEWKKKQR